MRTLAIRPRRVHDFVSSIFDYDLHAKRVASLADATLGALQGAQLAVGALGPGSRGREGAQRRGYRPMPITDSGASRSAERTAR